MKIDDWGLISFQEALSRQNELVESVSAGAEDVLVFCTHPPVVTLGRGTKPEDVTTWAGEVVEISRGGRATFHGPSQIVVYPIINLTKQRKNMVARDLHSYLRALENSIVQTLLEFGLTAEVRTTKVDGEPSLTGVWINDLKVASIGIGVRKWTAFHGIAINMDSDPQAFQGIRPCGFNANVMTSIVEMISLVHPNGEVPKREDIKKTLEKILISYLS